MARVWHTTDEIVTRVYEEITRLGDDAYGPNNGATQLFSGPSREVLKEIFGKPTRNDDRAFKQANDNDAVVLDKTKIGVFLSTFEGIGVYQYIADNPFIPADEKQDAIDKIFGAASEKFITSLWGHVSTAVCGAAKDRVFYNREIPTFAFIIPQLIARLEKSNDIETVNGIPSAKIRAQCKVGDYDAALRLICLGEIRQAWLRAKMSRSKEDYQDYLERKEFYLVERGLTWAGTAKGLRDIYCMSADERHARNENLMSKFMAAKLKAVAAGLVSGAITPSTPSVSIAKKSGDPRVA